MSDAPAEPVPARTPADLGSLIVSVAVLALFGFTVVASSFGLTVADGPARLLETALTLVVGYWLGSSNGSRIKDSIMETLRR